MKFLRFLTVLLFCSAPVMSDKLPMFDDRCV